MTRTHIIDPDAFTRSRVERAWCGTYGARFSPMVEHPSDADCQRCLNRWRAWERREELLLIARRGVA